MSYGPLALYISTAKKTSTQPPIVDMGLSNLPAVVLDVLVEFAGYEQGWRLEIASQSLKAASMECAAIRLGKCRWVGGDREGIAFKPSWRHVAAATRRGPYLVAVEFRVPHFAFALSPRSRRKLGSSLELYPNCADSRNRRRHVISGRPLGARPRNARRRRAL